MLGAYPHQHTFNASFGNKNLEIKIWKKCNCCFLPPALPVFLQQISLQLSVLLGSLDDVERYLPETYKSLGGNEEEKDKMHIFLHFHKAHPGPFLSA